MASPPGGEQDIALQILRVIDLNGGVRVRPELVRSSDTSINILSFGAMTPQHLHGVVTDLQGEF